jgi:hypothetical protein
MESPSGKVVEFVFPLIKFAYRYPEKDATNEGESSHGTIVPDKERIVRKN